MISIETLETIVRRLSDTIHGYGDGDATVAMSRDEIRALVLAGQFTLKSLKTAQAFLITGQGSRR
jgi:hypothetical protein